MQDGKRCRKCKRWLPFSSFHKSQAYMEGVRARCKECVNKHNKETRDPVNRRKIHMRYAFGMTMHQYNKMLEEQGGVCAICKKPETRRAKNGAICPLCIDHCHRTGDVRALLCNACNTALGVMGEDPEHIRALAEYADWCQTREPSVKIVQLPLIG